jgi:anti-sigma B factor antagonist
VHVRGTGPEVTTEPEPEPPLDVRLYAPCREVVVVRVSGSVDARSAGLLDERVGQQLSRSPHVVVDLSDVSYLGSHAVDVLRRLHERACAAGSRLHLTAEHDAVRRPLHLSGLDEVVPVSAAADAVVAEIAFAAASAPQPFRHAQSDTIVARTGDQMRRLVDVPAPRREALPATASGGEARRGWSA